MSNYGSMVDFGGNLDAYTSGVARALGQSQQGLKLGMQAFGHKQERDFNEQMQEKLKGRGVNPFLAQAAGAASSLLSGLGGGFGSSGSSGAFGAAGFRMAGDAFAPTLQEQGFNVPDFSSVFR